MSDETMYDGTGMYDEGGDSILDIDTSDAIEPTVVEDGEYEIRITGFQKQDGKIVRTSESGWRGFIVLFDIPSEMSSKGFNHIFTIPTEDMEPKRANSVKWDLETFKRAFGLTEINFNAMIGKTGWAMLKKFEDGEYGMKNKITKFIAGPSEAPY